MRCLLMLALVVVAAHGASISSSVSAKSSSDGRETTFSSQQFSDDPNFNLGTRSNFGSFSSRQPANVPPPLPVFSLGARGNFGRPAAPGLGDVQEELNRVAGHLGNVQHSLMG